MPYSNAEGPTVTSSCGIVFPSAPATGGPPSPTLSTQPALPVFNRHPIPFPLPPPRRPSKLKWGVLNEPNSHWSELGPASCVPPARQGETEGNELPATSQSPERESRQGEAGGSRTETGTSVRRYAKRTIDCLTCRKRKIKCDNPETMRKPCPSCGSSEDSRPGTGKPEGANSPTSRGRAVGGAAYVITQNITHNYGTVTNVGSIETANFIDPKYDSRHPWPDPTTVGPPVKPRVAGPAFANRNVSSPPNAFVTFSTALTRARYSSELRSITDEETSDIVLAAWDGMSTSDRERISMEAEHADELHLAMQGSEKMEIRGEVQKDKYWSFATRMTDFWLQKWNEAQFAVKAHFKRLGRDLLMLRTDVGTTGVGVDSPSIKPSQGSSGFTPGVSINKQAKKKIFRDSHRAPGQGPGEPGLIGKLLGRVGKKGKEGSEVLGAPGPLCG